MFTNKNLEVGMLAEFRDGRKFMVMPTSNNIVMIDEKGGYIRLSSYSEILYCRSYKDLDVMKVWGLSTSTPLEFNVRERILLWEREEPKYHVVLPLGTFRESDKYLKYDIGLKRYYFGTNNEWNGCSELMGIKTQFTKEEANTLKRIISSTVKVVESKGEKE